MARRPGAAPGIAGFGNLRTLLVCDVHLQCGTASCLNGRPGERADRYAYVLSRWTGTCRIAAGDYSFKFAFESFGRAVQC